MIDHVPKDLLTKYGYANLEAFLKRMDEHPDIKRYNAFEAARKAAASV